MADSTPSARSRRATSADHEAVIAVWLRADAARGVARPPEAVTHVRDRLADPEAIVLVVETAGQVVGVTTGEPARANLGRGAVIPGLGHIGMVFVDPGHWGAGLGGVLVDDLLVELRAAGYRRVQLWVRESNDRARRLYGGRGFRPEGTRGVDDQGEPVLLMTLEL
jgi:ribosomal protein S18 acetylase RimI-like enzyme